ncbi:hypothetical protein GHT06_015113 [Daphnia sinensis]|uniref:Uncharacterized protein n=1 Tax=Daphnia sinensis TaxID=1820382 RepID=A0AAD5PWX7_9CRUS|nr:hypothetical protein GHT06_015113 [Daphnia sinensis]
MKTIERLFKSRLYRTHMPAACFNGTLVAVRHVSQATGSSYLRVHVYSQRVHQDACCKDGEVAVFREEVESEEGQVTRLPLQNP